MRYLFRGALAIIFLASTLSAKVVVFSEQNFPSVDTQPVSVHTLSTALGPDVAFADLDGLRNEETLRGTDLLVLPYGSAVPVEAWPAIERYLHTGGNLLIIGGKPLHVPVAKNGGSFTKELPQDTYSRVLGFRHVYTVPVTGEVKFYWRDGYSFFPRIEVRALRYFAVEGRLNGLGYVETADGTRAAAPVIVSDHFGDAMPGTRVVALDFDPKPGYWDSADGTSLIRVAADYARNGAAEFWIEAQYSTLRPGELPDLTLHLQRPGEKTQGAASQGPKTVQSGLQDYAIVELLSGSQRIDRARIALSGPRIDAAVPFRKTLPAGFYTVRATWFKSGKPREFYANGLQVEDISALEGGGALGVNGDFLTLGGKPFLPVGTNYFSTEANGWDFSGPRNALVWEKDFADMERHGVNFVRTGVWMPNAKFIEPSSGGVNERFLRNVEAYLAAAHRHHIAVNFTFYAFTPKVGEQQDTSKAVGPEPPPPNPWLDPGLVRAEHVYILSVVKRFGRVPWLSYDLINEPSFSNPRRIFHGNVPNGDPVELNAWQQWLEKKYVRLSVLASAWAVDPVQLGGFNSIPLPDEKHLNYERYGNQHEVRALDYNLFAQEMFADWVRNMVRAIRDAGSNQLINVGQDEGGVTDRVLNQFYATSGVSFTTNHTYWNDDALLWDSVAAKHAGIPNITGETGYQPVWAPDGSWRYDEFTGLALEERKWALGFAAGSSGAMQWDWDREADFGIERSDGSAKVWEDMMRNLGRFARQAAPYATGLQRPQVALILPQSLQMSVYNSEAMEAQQTAVRVLYQYNHTQAYAVGEYQIDTLGSPKLILLPSAYGLSDAAWSAIEARVRDGAVLLISGPFSDDPHLHPTDRAARVGLDYEDAPLLLREQSFHWTGGTLSLSYRGMKTTVLSRALLPDEKEWKELTLGKGKILFSVLPLELNDRLDAVAAVYAYALKSAKVDAVYTTTSTDPGLLICPTVLPHATLYVLTSETNKTAISFRDERSGKTFSGSLEPGRAALLLVGQNGTLITSYGWNSPEASANLK
ncbi:MAG TPA: alpha-amylase family protein [Terriglobales bacterium]|nr:alpha-amylase family protein [Terriglobales bacterium]